MKKVGIIAGSLREGAYSKSIAAHFAKILSAEFDTEIIEIGQLPLYNQDYDDADATPESYGAFRKKIGEKDGYLFVAPEYNRSYTPALKNALDIGSRPYGASVWAGKPAAIVSTAPGKIGGFGANHHLRQVMVFLDLYVMAQPEAYIGGVDKMLDDAGNVIDEGAAAFLKTIADGFVKWVGRF